MTITVTAHLDVHRVRCAVARRAASIAFAEMKARSRSRMPARDVRARLGAEGCNVVTSLPLVPSCRYPMGHVLRTTADAIGHAARLGEAGASLLLVRPDSARHSASMALLSRVHDALDLPICLVDTVVEPYQIYEARAYGVDAVILRPGILSEPHLAGLAERVAGLGMAAIAEVRTVVHAHLAVRAGINIMMISAPVSSPQPQRCSTAMRVPYPDTCGEIRYGLPSGTLALTGQPVRSVAELYENAAAGADAVIAAAGGLDAQHHAALVRRLRAAGQHPACPRLVGASGARASI